MIRRQKSPGYSVTVDEEGNEIIDYNKDTYDPKSNGKADLFQTNLFILFFATATIFLLIIISLIELAKRLFDIVFLYLCMPLSAATIPLDDGAKFKLWREAITSKIFAVYGTVIAVNLYIMFLDIIGAGINIGAAEWINTLFNLILMIGGALAASSGAKLFGQIIGASPDNGRNLGQTIYTGMMAAQATGGIARGAGRLLFGGKSRGGGGGGAAGGRSGGIPGLINRAGSFLLGNKYTKGLSAAKSLKDTLKGSFSENGGIIGMASKKVSDAYKSYKGRPTGDNGLLGTKDLK